MNDYQHPPQKRDESLQPLSRDHYTGLVQAERLRKAGDGSAADRQQALAGFVDAWQREIVEHFADEERLLTDMMTETEHARLLTEHRHLRELANQAQHAQHADDPDGPWCRQLGETLRDHIRWEERELFPVLQQRASPEQLARLAEHTAPIEQRRGRAKCDDTDHRS
jgi:hemerythrin-like domain-containing protein